MTRRSHGRGRQGVAIGEDEGNNAEFSDCQQAIVDSSDAARRDGERIDRTSSS